MLVDFGVKRIGTLVVLLVPFIMVSAVLSVIEPFHPVWMPVLALGAVVLVICDLLCRRCRKSFGKYKGVDAFFVREYGQVWSSHLDCGLLMNVVGIVKRLARKAPKGVKLVSTDEDRHRVRSLSVRAFQKILIELADTPGAVIVSVSHLNRVSRNPSRIQERIDAVLKSLGWTYRRCTRELTWYQSAWGRWYFKWPVEPERGETWFKVVVDGIVVWRLADKQPVGIPRLRMQS